MPGIQPSDLPSAVVIHPLVLLSVVDHYNRVAKDTSKRVVGILLGELSKGKIDITNSYAVPFEEDPKGDVWYLDHFFHENMFAMFKKVNAREKVIGWYSTGPKIRPADLEINELMRRYVPNPVYVIIDVDPKNELELPTDAYMAVDNVPEEKSKQERTFYHLPTEIGALEAEEVGVEHLLRDIRDIGGSTIADQVADKLNSLKGLKNRLEDMSKYLDAVLGGRLPANHQILYSMQDILNTLPDLQEKEIVKAFAVNTNDNHLVIYVSSLIRSIIALHNLINNKLTNGALELKEQMEEKEKEKQEVQASKKEETPAK